MIRLYVFVGITLLTLQTRGAEIQHRFLAKDESRAQLHYVDQFNPTNDWTLPLEKGCRDIRMVDHNRILVSCPDGFAEFDLNTCEKVHEVRHGAFEKTETVAQLANGNTLLGTNQKGITFFEVDPAGNIIRQVNFPQYKTLRLARLSPEGHLLFGANETHVIEADRLGNVLVDFEIPGAKHIYWIRKLAGGKAYRVSTGYGKTIVDITPAGKVLRTLGGGDDTHFFSRPFELSNGNTIACNWTGHKANDSQKAPQLFEFDPQGNVVWTWHAPERAGTIHGVIMLDDQRSKINRAALRDFEMIRKNIAANHPSRYPEYDQLAAQTLRMDALILEADQTPVDVILRRTQALMEHLEATQEHAALNRIRKRMNAGVSIEQQRALFLEIGAIRRRVAFSNPLLDFDSLLFLKHDPAARGDLHMVDQYFGLNQAQGGGLYRLDAAFSDSPKAVNVLVDTTVESGRLTGQKLDFNRGSFLSLDLDYEADELLFAYTELNWTNFPGADDWKEQPWTENEAGGAGERNKHYCFKPDSSFHIFKARTDGSNLAQLTDGRWDDFDPVFLPSGRITFMSARAGGNQRCGWRYLPTYTLFGMMPDGSDIQQFSWHDTNEWHPSVNNDGMLVYTRWDYVDRDSDIAHHLWSCYPDGRDPRSIHGNYPAERESRPWMEMSIRAIPESGSYLAVAAPHHGQAYGSLILIDPSIPDDRAMAQVKRITPLSAFPESEGSPGRPCTKSKRNKYLDLHYGTPWPLSEDFYLCVYSDTAYGNYGIYLVDSFGNRELIYRDSAIACTDPIPLKPRTCPPQLPVQTQQMQADREADADLSTGTISVMNVYEGEFPIPAGVKIKEMRIINLFPKSTHSINNPRIGYADQSLARGVLGTVPVEADGSVHFECPTGMGIYFQLLDENGMMVQNMRTDTYLHPGEQLTCIGCHENRHQAPRITGVPMALKRAPSTIKPEAPGTYPLSFPRLVQPVLDAHPEFFAELFPGKSLSGTTFGKYGWSEAMHTLSQKAWGKHGGNGAIRKNGRSYSVPMQEGARVSELFRILEKAGADKILSAEEMRRITLWLDCNSNFYGAYKETARQARGEIIHPTHGTPAWHQPETFTK